MVSKTEKVNKHTVDIVFVGGGPATLGLLTNACKNNKLNELVGKGDSIAILEANMSFGQGGLHGFGINSNTSANGFIKCLYKRREIAKNPNQSASPSKTSPKPAVAETVPEGSPQRKKLKEKNCGLEEDDSDEAEEQVDEEDIYQPQKYEYIALNPYVDIYKQSPLCQMAFEYGPAIIPLSAVGMIMNYTGNHLLQFIHKAYGRKIFFPFHKVISVQLMANGECVTTAMRTEVSIILDPSSEDDNGQLKDSQGYKIIKHTETQVTFRSKAVVLSNGGVQNIHPQFYNWFPCMKDRLEDVVLSDYFLQKTGYIATMKRIQSENKKKIVIIGGSHSGFSAAFMMLNGPTSLIKNSVVTPSCAHDYNNTGKFTFPGTQLKTDDKCNRCCSCFYLKKDKTIGPKDKCICVCRCYGFFKYADWGYDYNELPSWSDGSIKILYRDKIRVFYNRVSAAIADGYGEYKASTFTNKNGYLYSFTGLRGDAKKLYKSIVKKEEKRVRLVHAPEPVDQLKHIEEADIVIWACGYQTNPIVVRDVENKVVEKQSKVAFTQCDVDQKCRIITSDNNILTKTFGSGLAYPLRTNDGMIISEAGKSNPRADSFSLYSNFVANTMLGNLLPKSRLENKLHKTTRPNRKGLNPPKNQTQTSSNNVTQTSRTNATSSTTANSQSRTTNHSSTFNKATINTPKPVIVPSRQPVSPRNSSAFKPTVANLHNSKDPQQAASSPRPTSQGAIKPELTQFIPIGEVGIPGQTPGYLAMNYISQQRAVSNHPAESKKKQAWVPSSKMQAPINRIPKDTHKAIEQRIAIQNARDIQKVGVIATNLQPGQFNEYQAVLAESYSGAVSKTLSVTDAVQLYSGSDGSTLQKTPNIPFPLNTTNLQDQIGEGLDAVSNLPNQYALASSFKLSNQNTMGSANNSFYNQAILDGAPTPATSPLKNVVASPLVYNQKASLEHNTPQVHRRKASFKLVQSGGKELNSSQSIAISQAPSNNNTMLVDYNGSTMLMNTNQINSKLMSQVNESHANKNYSATGNQMHAPVKPASQSQIKRHSTTTSTSKNKKSKKSLQSTQKQAGHHANYLADGGSGEKQYTMSTQKSSPNIKAKRIGAFAKNPNGKQFQQQDQSTLKSDKQTYPSSSISQQNQQLSNLASAGQRQIFNDDISVSSAKRKEQVNKFVAQGIDTQPHVPKSISTIEQFEFAGPHTPKQHTMPDQIPSQQASSNSRRRSTLNTIKNNARSLPMSDNFVLNYQEQSQQNNMVDDTKQHKSSHYKLLPKNSVDAYNYSRQDSQSLHGLQMHTQNSQPRRERMIMSSHKERRIEAPSKDDMDLAQLTLSNQNSVNNVYKTPQKTNTKSIFPVQRHPSNTDQLASQCQAEAQSPVKTKLVPRTQRSASKSNYQPGIIVSNPVMQSENGGESPQKQLIAYHKQIQSSLHQNLNNISHGHQTYVDMAVNSEGRANSTSVVPVKIFQLPITHQQNQNVPSFTQVVNMVPGGSENSILTSQAIVQNAIGSGNSHRKNIPSQPNQQSNSNVANYGLMYVNPNQSPNKVIRTVNNMIPHSINKEKRTNMVVAQQFNNSPMKTTPSKMQAGYVNTNNLNMYIMKPQVVQNSNTLNQSPPMSSKGKTVPDHSLYRVIGGHSQPPGVASQLVKSFKQQQYNMQQQQVVKQTSTHV